MPTGGLCSRSLCLVRAQGSEPGPTAPSPPPPSPGDTGEDPVSRGGRGPGPWGLGPQPVFAGDRAQLAAGLTRLLPPFLVKVCPRRPQPSGLCSTGMRPLVPHRLVVLSVPLSGPGPSVLTVALRRGPRLRRRGLSVRVGAPCLSRSLQDLSFPPLLRGREVKPPRPQGQQPLIIQTVLLRFTLGSLSDRRPFL